MPKAQTTFQFVYNLFILITLIHTIYKLFNQTKRQPQPDPEKGNGNHQRDSDPSTYF